MCMYVGRYKYNLSIAYTSVAYTEYKYLIGYSIGAFFSNIDTSTYLLHTLHVSLNN